MEITNQKDELKRVKTALFLNLLPTGFGLYELIASMNSGTTWRIVCAAVGFGGMLLLSIFVFARLLKLQKAEKILL
ncbi:hypothetical protein SAMN05216490_3541 [Mucilaginibacter mallensis]|uniref:Uncharacterized protein n=1 Tax=Mucilaginibacter mallensis TaxID=652787 RepID=A0A1H2AHI5_MUCMA|nr:hypothetical protein [Mucilaginibacter mallensis]SDT45431.1 hypothetical protein SAMN05216490_3541 [Mucilaginibacter mallensis]